MRELRVCSPFFFFSGAAAFLPLRALASLGMLTVLRARTWISKTASSSKVDSADASVGRWQVAGGRPMFGSNGGTVLWTEDLVAQLSQNTTATPGFDVSQLRSVAVFISCQGIHNGVGVGGSSRVVWGERDAPSTQPATARYRDRPIAKQTSLTHRDDEVQTNEKNVHSDGKRNWVMILTVTRVICGLNNL